MNFLEKVLGTALYEKQKELGKKVLDNVKDTVAKEINEKKEDLYVLQKDAIKKIQQEAMKEIRKRYAASVEKLYDKMVENIAKKGFIGKLVSKYLKVNKDKILDILG